MNKDEFYCPIRKNFCFGKECTFAVKIDDPFSSPYFYNYVCGLVNIYDHGIPKYIDSEPRIDDQKDTHDKV